MQWQRDGFCQPQVRIDDPAPCPSLEQPQQGRARLRDGSRDQFPGKAAPGALCACSRGSSALQHAPGVLPCCFQLPRITFPNFRVPLVSIGKGAEVLDCEAALAPPLSPSRGSMSGRVGFFLGFGVVFFLGGWRG